MAPNWVPWVRNSLVHLWTVSRMDCTMLSTVEDFSPWPRKWSKVHDASESCVAQIHDACNTVECKATLDPFLYSSSRVRNYDCVNGSDLKLEVWKSHDSAQHVTPSLSPLIRVLISSHRIRDYCCLDYSQTKHSNNRSLTLITGRNPIPVLCVLWHPI